MPNQTEVTVRGSATSHHPPQLASVELVAVHQGPDQAVAYQGAVETGNGLVALIRPLADGVDAPVARWAADRMHTWMERPWGPDGSQLGPVWHARAQVRATFRDLDRFGRFLDDVAVRPGVEVQQTTWALTEDHEREAAREVRRRAVQDATDRARDYAEAAGFSTVEVVAIADVGLLGDASRARPAMYEAQSLAAMTSAGPMEFAPEDIVVSATVEARFLAS